MDELDDREMVFWVAEYNRTRHWPTARGSASACWGVLCGEQTADPLELEAIGWRVVKCVGTAVETDLRFRAVASCGTTEIEQLRARLQDAEQVRDQRWQMAKEAKAEIERLQEFMIKTADGVPITAGIELWRIKNGDVIHRFVMVKDVDVEGPNPATECYSTLEAAEEAKNQCTP